MIKLPGCNTGDPRFDKIIIGCGKCAECLNAIAMEWQFRIRQEDKKSISSYFITLTYNDDHLPADFSVHKSHLQNFVKRMRKQIKLRYFGCGEYGDEDSRPHYHILFFFNEKVDLSKIDNLLSKCWKLGFYKIGTVGGGAIVYVTKYILKMEKSWMYEKLSPPFRLMSRKPGLGSSFLTPSMTEYMSQGDGKFEVVVDGKKYCIPRYYKDKVLSKEQKEKHRYYWMEKVLDEGVFYSENGSKYNPDKIIQQQTKLYNYELKQITKQNLKKR